MAVPEKGLWGDGGGITSVLEGTRGTDPRWPSCHGSVSGQGRCLRAAEKRRAAECPSDPSCQPCGCPVPAQSSVPRPPSGCLVGQGAFSAPRPCPPYVCVSRSGILSVPRRDVGFLCPDCPGCTLFLHGPALLPGARQTPEPGARPPVCWPSCPSPLTCPSAGTGFSSHSLAGSSAPDRVQTLQSPWSQLCEQAACDRVGFIGAPGTAVDRHRRKQT